MASTVGSRSLVRSTIWRSASTVPDPIASGLSSGRRLVLDAEEAQHMAERLAGGQVERGERAAPPSRPPPRAASPSAIPKRPRTTSIQGRYGTPAP